MKKSQGKNSRKSVTFKLTKDPKETDENQGEDLPSGSRSITRSLTRRSIQLYSQVEENYRLSRGLPAVARNNDSNSSEEDIEKKIERWLQNGEETKTDRKKSRLTMFCIHEDESDDVDRSKISTSNEQLIDKQGSKPEAKLAQRSTVMATTRASMIQNNSQPQSRQSAVGTPKKRSSKLFNENAENKVSRRSSAARGSNLTVIKTANRNAPNAVGIINKLNRRTITAAVTSNESEEPRRVLKSIENKVPSRRSTRIANAIAGTN